MFTGGALVSAKVSLVQRTTMDQSPFDAVHLLRVKQQGRGDVVVQRRVYETFDIHLNEGDCLVHLFKGDPNGGMSAEAQVFALVQLDAASRSR